MIFQFFPLKEEEIKTLIERALRDREKGIGEYDIHLTPEAMVIRGKHQDGIAQVLSNTSVLIKSKYENNQVSPELLEDMHFVEQLERQRQISQTMQICA